MSWGYRVAYGLGIHAAAGHWGSQVWGSVAPRALGVELQAPPPPPYVIKLPYRAYIGSDVFAWGMAAQDKDEGDP